MIFLKTYVHGRNWAGWGGKKGTEREKNGRRWKRKKTSQAGLVNCTGLETDAWPQWRYLSRPWKSFWFEGGKRAIERFEQDGERKKRRKCEVEEQHNNRLWGEGLHFKPSETQTTCDYRDTQNWLSHLGLRKTLDVEPTVLVPNFSSVNGICDVCPRRRLSYYIDGNWGSLPLW